MQIKISLVVCEDAVESDRQSLLTLEVDAQPTIATLGLSLADGKAMLAQLQAQVVTRQVELLVARQRRCENCGLIRTVKDYHDIHYGSLFGNVRQCSAMFWVRVPRWRRCACSTGVEIADHRGRRWISAELEFVQSQLAATIPYAKSAELLGLLLPVAGANAPSTVREHTLGVGRRLNAQGLQVQTEVAEVMRKPAITTVGLDSGYLRHCHPDHEKSFEVVVGRAMRAGVGQRSLAFVLNRRQAFERAGARSAFCLRQTRSINGGVHRWRHATAPMAVEDFAPGYSHTGLVPPATTSQQAQRRRAQQSDGQPAQTR
ncbi:hypothetical protein LP417_22235 [Polaromonas sp. P1-6]|nr:hypothetical protein LP417_22235 [Polaromonas sp. P1-6]